MAYLGQGPFQEFSNPPTKDSFTGDGSTVAFDMDQEVPSGSQNALEVFVDNVRQEPGTGKAFTLGVDGSGDTKRITFSSAPANGASIYVINDKTNSTIVAPLQNDLNGTELILDVDGDTSITADTDDRIDFKIANVEHFSFSNSSGDTVIKPMVDAKDILFQQYDGRTLLDINDGGYIAIANGATGSGELRIYEDTDNGTNYSGFKVGAQSADIDYVLPTADGSSGQKLTTNGSGTLSWADTNLPTSANGQALGSASLEWSDLFLADGAVINFGADQDINLTHVHNTGLTTNGDFTVGDDLFVSGGVIDLKNTGTASQIHLYCESSNAHAQIIQGAPHSQGASNTLILPDGGNGTLLSTVSTATVTNKTFTSPKINEDVAVTTTATEINLIDGGTSRGTTAVATGDGILINDGGTMRMTNVDTVSTYFSSHNVGGGNIVTTGALGSGSIAAGFGNIDNGASNITSGGLVSLDVDADADDVTGDSATGRLTLGAGQDLNLYHGGTNSYIVNDTGDLILKTGASDEDMIFQGNDGGAAITALTLDMSAAGAATFNSTVAATGFIIGSADIAEAELELLDGLTAGTAIASKVVTTDANIDSTGIRNLTITGELDAATLDISGAIDVAGTANLDVVDIDGAVDMASTLQVDGVATFTAVPVFPNDTIETADIQADAITGAKIADDAIDSEHYTDGSIDTAHIGDSQVTAAKLAQNSVDSSELIDGSIDTSHLSADCITEAKIADNALQSEHYQDGSIDTAHLADSQITVAKMAANSVDTDQYVDGSIDTVHIADNQITLAKMAGGTDGNLITYDASGDPAYVATGSDGQVLTSTGAGSAPAFEALPGTGKILQTVFVQNATDVAFPQNTTLNTTIVSAAITPTATNSKIIIHWSYRGEMNGGSYPAVSLALSRTISGSATGLQYMYYLGYQGNDSGHRMLHHPGFYQESPNTTSEITYYLYGGNNTGSSFSGTYGGHANGNNNKSEILIMEIGV